MNMKKHDQSPVIILGAGGHAKVLINMLQRNNTPIIGITGKNKINNNFSTKISYLGDDSVITKYKPNEVLLVNGLGSLPGKNQRKLLANKFRKFGYQFLSVIDDTAIIANDVELAEGVQIMAGVIIQPGSKIGTDSIINTSSSIDHDCTIGSFCHIAPGVTLSGEVYVGDNTHIGTGSCIIQGIRVGSNCIVAAGSALHKNIKDKIKITQKRQEAITNIEEHSNV